MTGDASLVRISASGGRAGPCPEQQAAKARPAMRPARRSRARKSRLTDFPLEPVMAALDAVELRGQPVTEAVARLGREGKPLHPGVMRWACHAVTGYLAGAAGIGTPAVTAVPHFWVAQHTDNPMTWEMYAWGRRYESSDGTIRELRLTRLGAADGGHRAPATVAIAAYSVAFGVPAVWPERWDEPFRPANELRAKVQQVRILAVGLEDGSHVVLFDGSPRQAEALYAEHARARVREVAVGGTPLPGTACADCKLVTACDALPRFPGVLGITEPTAPLRTWSVTNGRQYSACPARDHLIRLRLPRESEYGPAAVRGQAVHAWLAENHAGPLHSACTVWDVPAQPDDWTSGEWHVTGEQALTGAQMLARHADLCAFHHGRQITQVRLEPTLAFHDTSANVIVIAKPDLLYLDDGACVWRETKTRQQLPRPGPDLLRDFPQVALATVLMAENALGGKPSGQRIELELLSPDEGDVPLVDPSDPAEISRARTVIHDLAAPWHADETYAARPGPHCAECPVRRWCPDAEVVT